MGILYSLAVSYISLNTSRFVDLSASLNSFSCPSAARNSLLARVPEVGFTGNMDRRKWKHLPGIHLFVLLRELLYITDMRLSVQYMRSFAWRYFFSSTFNIYNQPFIGLFYKVSLLQIIFFLSFFHFLRLVQVYYFGNKRSYSTAVFRILLKQYPVTCWVNLWKKNCAF